MQCPSCSAPYSINQNFCEFCNCDLSQLRSNSKISRSHPVGIANSDDLEGSLIREIEALANKIDERSFAFSDLKRLQYIDGKLSGDHAETASALFASLVEKVYCDYVEANSLCLYGRTQELFDRFSANAK